MRPATVFQSARRVADSVWVNVHGLVAQTGSGVGIKIGIKWLSAEPQIG
jgi:hypothetical protein